MIIEDNFSDLIDPIDKTDEHWMREALKEAGKALQEDEVPIGAVIVHNGKIIGRGHNMTERLNDVTAHAEMIAITAAENIAGKYLEDCSLYVTLEPCSMCAGAIGWSHIRRVVYGAADTKRGYTIMYKTPRTPMHPRTTVVSGVLASECGALVSSYFLSKRGKFSR